MIKILRKNFLKILIATSLALLAGGWIYFYHTIESITNHYYRLGLALIMALHNCAESLLCNPILSIPDVFEEFDTFSFGLKIILLIYSVFLMVVPIIEVFIAFSILDKVFRFLGEVSINKPKVLVVGFNECTKRIIDATRDSFKEKYKVCIWTDEVLSEEVLNDLYKKHIKVFTKENIDLTKSEDGADGSNNEFDQKISSFLESNKIERIVLMNDSDARNIREYITLSSCEFCKKHTVHYYVNIQDFEMKKVLNDYFDKNIKNRNDEIKELYENDKDTHMDLRVFNIPQIQAERLLLDENFPLYRNEVKKNIFDNSDISPKPVHLMIIGGGMHGREILYHAMNQSVLSPDNKIIIDVIDNDINSVKIKLEERLKSVKSTEITEDKKTTKIVLQMKIPNLNNTDNTFNEENIDETLIITLREMDALASDFGCSLTRELDSEAKNVFNHIVICLPDDESNIRAAKEICSYGPKKSAIAIRLDDNNKMREYFETLLGEGKGRVYLYGSEITLFGLETIINEEEEKEIKQYHLTYSSFNFDIKETGKEPDTDAKLAEVEWNKTSSYKRDSNRALYHHRKIKDYFFDQSSFKGFFEKKDNIIIPDRLSKNGKRLYDDDKSKAVLDKEKYIRIYYAEKLDVDSKNQYEGVKDDYKEVIKYAKTEHRRWNYFFISEGWLYGSEKDESRRVHDCLSGWELLYKDHTDCIVYDLQTIKNLEQHKEIEGEKSSE